VEVKPRFDKIAVPIMLAGLALILHDLLYHLTGRFGLGRDLMLWGVHLHHGYIGVALILIGLVWKLWQYLQN